MSNFPGWRTMTGSQRHNAKMSKLFENCKAIERQRIADGELPNPNLTDINSLTLEQLRKIVSKAAGYRA